MAVKRHSTASAHQGGNLTVGKIPDDNPVFFEDNSAIASACPI